MLVKRTHRAQIHDPQPFFAISRATHTIQRLPDAYAPWQAPEGADGESLVSSIRPSETANKVGLDETLHGTMLYNWALSLQRGEPSWEALPIRASVESFMVVAEGVKALSEDVSQVRLRLLRSGRVLRSGRSCAALQDRALPRHQSGGRQATRICL